MFEIILSFVQIPKTRDELLRFSRMDGGLVFLNSRHPGEFIMIPFSLDMRLLYEAIIERNNSTEKFRELPAHWNDRSKLYVCIRDIFLLFEVQKLDHNSSFNEHQHLQDVRDRYLACLGMFKGVGTMTFESFFAQIVGPEHVEDFQECVFAILQVDGYLRVREDYYKFRGVCPFLVYKY